MAVTPEDRLYVPRRPGTGPGLPCLSAGTGRAREVLYKGN